MDAARGWSPDGSRVLFASTRETVPVPGLPSIFRLWSVAVGANGAVTAVPEVLPMPRAFTGSYSPDGRRIAYEEIGLGFAADWAQNQSSLWRNYRGGRTRPIRLINLADHAVEKLPWTNSNDSAPMWVGDTVYFLSDRNGTTNLFSLPDRRQGRHRAHPSRRLRRDERVGRRAMPSSTSRAAICICWTWRRSRRAGSTIEVAGDFPVGADAAEESRQHGAQRRAVADRRARRLRGPRRDLHGADREGPAAQPDAVVRHARSQPGLVARRPRHRLAVGRERRVSTDDRRADRRHQAADDRAAVEGVLLRAGLVTRRQAAAARGQPPGVVVHRRGQRRGDEARHRHLR